MNRHRSQFVALIFSVLLASLFLLSDLGSAATKGSIGVGVTGSQWYIFASAISQISAAQKTGVDLIVKGTGGGAENQRLAGKGEMEFGFTLAPDTGEAYAGRGVYKGQQDQFKLLRAVFAYPYGGTQICVVSKSNIKRMADLKGKKISVGAPGSSGAVFFNPVILAEHGVTKENSKFEYLTVTTAGDQLKDGHIDAMIVQQRDPMSQIMDLSVFRPVRLIPLEKDAMERIFKKIPGTYEETVPAKLYGDRQVNEEDVRSLGFASMLVTHSKMSEKDIYSVTRALFDNLPEFYRSHAGAKAVTLEGALKGMTIPLHVGAMKYFQEKGTKIPSDLVSPDVK